MVDKFKPGQRVKILRGSYEGKIYKKCPFVANSWQVFVQPNGNLISFKEKEIQPYGFPGPVSDTLLTMRAMFGK